MNKKISKLLREYEKDNHLYLDGRYFYSKDVVNILNSNIYSSLNDDLNSKLDELFKDNIKVLFKCNYSVLSNCDVKNILNVKTLVINSTLSGDNIINYQINDLIDYEEIRNIIILNNIKILFVGSEYYSRFIDYKRLKEIISEVKGKLFVDISYILEFVINNRIECPSRYADLIMFSRFKYNLFISNQIINIDDNYELKYKLALLQYLFDVKEIDIDKISDNINKLFKAFLDNNIYVVSNGSDNNLIRIRVDNAERVASLLRKNGIEVRKNNSDIVLNLVNNYLNENYYEVGKRISNIINT